MAHIHGDSGPVNADTSVSATLASRPAAARVFIAHGMQCVGCAFAPHETIAEVCANYEIALEPFLGELSAACEGAADAIPNGHGGNLLSNASISDVID